VCEACRGRTKRLHTQSIDAPWHTDAVAYWYEMPAATTRLCYEAGMGMLVVCILECMLVKVYVRGADGHGPSAAPRLHSYLSAAALIY
jgi:hypothetical protein